MSDATVIGHREIAGMNPLSSSTLDHVVASLDLRSDARVLDFGCGKGDLLRRIAHAYGCYVEGVDVREELIEAARAAVPSGTFHVADARTWPFEEGARDVAACVGASHALGGPEAALSALARAVKLDGVVLYGEAFLRREVPPEYRAVLGDDHGLLSLDRTIARAWGAGFALRDTFVASEADFGRYELAHARAISAYAAAHPGDARASAMRDRSRRWLDAFERWGRTTMGFALFVLGKQS